MFFHILFHYGLSQNIEYSFLCYTVGPCFLPISYSHLLIPESQSISPSPSPPWQLQVCSLCLWVETISYCGLRGLFFMWAHPYVACMGLVLFHARAVFSVGTCRLFPQCMPAIIPLMGSVAGGVTKACTGYSARPPLCYAQPEVSTLISAPLCAWAVC